MMLGYNHHGRIQWLQSSYSSEIELEDKHENLMWWFIRIWNTMIKFQQSIQSKCGKRSNDNNYDSSNDIV
jgi:hypothetical protein